SPSGFLGIHSNKAAGGLLVPPLAFPKRFGVPMLECFLILPRDVFKEVYSPLNTLVQGLTTSAALPHGITHGVKLVDTNDLDVAAVLARIEAGSLVVAYIRHSFLLFDTDSSYETLVTALVNNRSLCEKSVIVFDEKDFPARSPYLREFVAVR